MTYKINNWDDCYENNRTRKMKIMQWVPLKNSHDTDSYTQLMEKKNSMALFGAWVLIVQVASKCHPRGTLVRSNGKPHDCDSLARITRGEAKVFSQALKVLCEIGWIVEIGQKSTIPLGCPESAPSCPESAIEEKGREGNRIEGNRIEERSKKFKLEVYATDNPLEIKKGFYDYWSELNPSKTKMKFEMQKTWETSKRLATWIKNDKKFTPSNNKPRQYGRQDVSLEEIIKETSKCL